MRLVIDANVLVAAFLKAALTRTLLLDERLELYSPEHLLIEAKKVLKDRLKKESEFFQTDFDLLFDLLTARIRVVPKEDYISFLKKALEIAPHEEDAPYFACALYLSLPIWSNDNGMREQSLVQVIPTQELVKQLISPGA